MTQEFPTKEWKKSILNDFRNIWKNIVLLFESAGVQGQNQCVTLQQNIDWKTVTSATLLS